MEFEETDEKTPTGVTSISFFSLFPLSKNRCFSFCFLSDFTKSLLLRSDYIKAFVGTSANAVEIQIWTALITILLLFYLKQIAQYPWCLSNLVSSLRLNTFTKIDLEKWLNEPFKPPPDEVICP